MGKPTGESRYGFSEDEDLIEHALDELIQAMDRKDGNAAMDAIKALVRVIRNKTDQDPGDENVADAR